MSDWFSSIGIKRTYDSKPEILVPISLEHLNLLKNIEDFAIQSGLQLPKELQSNVSNEVIYKRIPKRSSLYLKVNHDAMFFDNNCQPLRVDDLSRGDYRVQIHIKGLYIGQHPAGKLVSMQIRIVQLQFIPRVCVFTPVVGLMKFPQHPRKKFECEECGKHFASNFNIKRHKKTKHGDRDSVTSYDVSESESDNSSSITSSPRLYGLLVLPLRQLSRLLMGIDEKW